jgi:hypothetical protein
MTTQDITGRIENLAVGTIAAVALVAILAHVQHTDEADDAAVRAHVAQQASAK